MLETFENINSILLKALNYKKLKMFINLSNELILVPKLNAYLCLNHIKSEFDFKCRLIEYLSFYLARNHWDDYYSPKLVKFFNYILEVNFTKKDYDLIYQRLGNGINHALAVKFVSSNYDLKLLKGEN